MIAQTLPVFPVCQRRHRARGREAGRSLQTASTVATTSTIQPAIRGAPGDSCGNVTTAAMMSAMSVATRRNGPPRRGSTGAATRGALVAVPHL